MIAEPEPAMAKNPEHSLRTPPALPPDSFDLDRVVFDPEYRARVRDALNQAGLQPNSKAARKTVRKNRGAT